MKPSFAYKYPGYQQHFLANDASPRKYFRWVLPEKTLVLMSSPPEETNTQFILMSEYLRKLGLSAPAILEVDNTQGFLLLEDLGNNTFTKVLKHQPEMETTLYQQAIHVLHFLQTNTSSPPNFIKCYTLQEVLKEVSIFIDYYWPYYFNKFPEKRLIAEFLDLWKEAIKYVWDVPNSIILRDYHIDNLMLLERSFPQDVGLLDFQDAVWGPIGFDVMSLLEDARRDVSISLQDAIWNDYLKSYSKTTQSSIRRSANILSAARHVKILGIFTRLAQTQGKSHYINHLPRVWKYLWRCLKMDPLLKDLNNWFIQYFHGNLMHSLKLA